MKMDFTLHLTQEQKLIMTQQMQLSVKLLQMSSYELQEFVEKEVEENPMLEVTYKGEVHSEKEKERIEYKELAKYFEFDNYSHCSYEKDEEEVSPFYFISEKISLKDYLKEQVLEFDIGEKDVIMCNYIIDNLDQKGYLDSSTESIACAVKRSKEDVETMLAMIQGLEPAGIGARDLKECLKLQIVRKGIADTALFQIIENHLEDLGNNRYSVIAKDLTIDMKTAQVYGDFIKTLEPKPTRGFYTGEETKYVTPDAYIKKINDEFYIVMNEALLPKLTINDMYRNILNAEVDKQAVNYVKGKLNSALFLMKSIEQRKSTIYRVIEKIVDLQKQYFEGGETYLKPMTLKEIAENLGMHESTISRAIRDKYIHTSKGTIKLKDLFTNGLSSVSNEEVSTRKIKTAIKELIEKENKEKPLSDQIICEMLNEAGMNISRRTVAKYREELNIKSSSKRKRF